MFNRNWRLGLTGFVFLCSLCSVDVLAQAPPSEAAQKAEAAEAANELERALKLYELAYREDAQAVYIYKRVLIYERQGKLDFALSLLEENRAALSTDPQITDLALVEQRLRDAKQRQDASKSSAASSTSTSTWVALGGGAALSVGGVVMLVLAGQEADDRACSVNSDAYDPSCQGQPRLTSQQFEVSRSSQQLYSILGVSGLVLGLGAISYGVIDLLSFGPAPEASESAQRDTWSLMPVRGGASVQWMWRF